MKVIDTRIHIDAPLKTVWAVLTGFGAPREWDPQFAAIEGELGVGARLAVRFRKGITMHPRITSLDQGHVLEWLGSLGVRGLFDGRHRFELTPSSDGRSTDLHQTEQFSGVLVPLLGRLLRDTEHQFEAFNAALKTRAESAPVWADAQA